MSSEAIYVWHEFAFVSGEARYAKISPRLDLFRDRPRNEIVGLLLSYPRWCPLRCGMSIGAWAEPPRAADREDASHE